MNKDRTHLKPKRPMKHAYESPNNYYHDDNYNAPSQSRGCRPFTGQGSTDNLEVSHNETEAKDLNIVNVSFRIIDIREAHPSKTVLNTAITTNPIFKEITMEAEVMAVALNILKDVVVVGPTIRVVMEHISISITHMTHSQNNMAHPAVYVVDLIIPLSIVTRENMI